jgi:hypothetical protein
MQHFAPINGVNLLEVNGFGKRNALWALWALWATGGWANDGHSEHLLNC